MLPFAPAHRCRVAIAITVQVLRGRHDCMLSMGMNGRRMTVDTCRGGYRAVFGGWVLQGRLPLLAF